jgi:hypothetical protein
MRPIRLARLLTVLALAVLATACGKDKATDPVVAAMPDFQLTDLNPNSLTAGELVSPRDYLQTVSVWYFGHST